ncbi:MAG: HvfB family MNIO-type RiPP peptide maturase [Chromatiales bacterium]
MDLNNYPVEGAGLGLRRSFMATLEAGTSAPHPVRFWEVAPENWIEVGGRAGRRLRAATEQTPLVCHGLCLNLGGPAPLDEEYLLKLKQFLDTHQVRCYGDHLSYCADDGHIYDLMPIPFTEEAVHHVAGRIRHVQEVLERRITVENPSYYCAPGQEMAEIDFINAVLDEADCDFLIDINNIYVNSVNHSYNPVEFLKALPGQRIAYAHIAGHYREENDLIVDSHGAGVIDPVWDLLDVAYQHFGVFPTLLERDFNIPSLDELLKEVDRIAVTQMRWTHTGDLRSVAHA